MPKAQNQKRLPTTSYEEQQRIVSAAGKVIEPPAHVPCEGVDRTFFDNIIDEFARAEWTAHQVELAAMLARTMSDFVEQQDLLRHEGMTDVTAKGTPCVNPRKAVVQMLSGTILSMRKSLALQSNRPGVGLPAKTAASKRIAKAVENAAVSGSDDLDSVDTLIAKPN
jgi:hypothetical protein